MISTRPGSPAALLLAEVVRYPGELSDRRICYGRICVAERPEVGTSPPSRWVERLRAAGLLRPARVRLMPHVTPSRIIDRLSGQEREVAMMLLAARDAAPSPDEDGLTPGDLARALGLLDADGRPDASGALERTLSDLYRAGYASPPAALWVTEAGRALVEDGASPPRTGA